MDRNSLWNLFKKSGSIEAYLLYKEKRKGGKGASESKNDEAES